MINASGKRLTKNQRGVLLCFLTLIATGSSALSNAIARESLPIVVAVLSEYKARIEGRAGLAQGCLKANQKTILGMLIIKFSDARIPFNAWIDGQIALLKTRPSQTMDEMTELFKLQELNNARRKGDEFVKVAESELLKNKCAVAYKIGWGTEILKTLGADAVKEFVQWLFIGGENRHQELIEILNSYKIVEWGNVSSILVYDWKQGHFYNVAMGKVNPEILKKGGTIAYLNKWGLKQQPSKLVLMDKELPPGLSPKSYIGYGGPIKDLKKYILQ